MQHFQSDYLHTLSLTRRGVPLHATEQLLEKNQGICGATQPDSEKAHMLRKRVSARIECRTAFIGRLPHSASATRIAAVSAPATRPPILAPSRSLYKQHFLRKFHLFQAPVRKALRVRPEPVVETTGLEPVTICLQSRRATNCATSPKDLSPRERNDKR